MNIRKLKSLITEKLGIPPHRITTEDAMEISVRFDHSGCRYRVTIDMQVEKIDGVCRAYDSDAKRVERLLRGAKWDGVDLPPVGSMVETVDPDGLLVYGHDESGEVIAYVENTAVVRMSYGLGCFEARFLRPLRSEADKKRDAAIERMVKVIGITPESAAICYEISLSGGV